MDVEAYLPDDNIQSRLAAVTARRRRAQLQALIRYLEMTADPSLEPLAREDAIGRIFAYLRPVIQEHRRHGTPTLPPDPHGETIFTAATLAMQEAVDPAVRADSTNTVLEGLRWRIPEFRLRIEDLDEVLAREGNLYSLLDARGASADPDNLPPVVPATAHAARSIPEASLATEYGEPEAYYYVPVSFENRRVEGAREGGRRHAPRMPITGVRGALVRTRQPSWRRMEAAGLESEPVEV
ncbi:hypothetical protein VTI74DRAFT_3347 [Chaetomium olivicolor]